MSVYSKDISGGLDKESKLGKVIKYFTFYCRT